jgi:hypothetical protein
MRELPGRSLAFAGAGRTGGAARVAAVAVLLVVAVAGLRAHGTFSRAAHTAAAGVTGSLLAILVATGEGVAVIAFIIVLAMARPERKRNPDTEEPPRPPIPWWAKTIGVLVAIAVMITPFVVLFSKKSKRLVAVQPPVGPRGVAPTGAGRLAGHAPGGGWPVIAGMVIAVAVVVALTVWSRRRRFADRMRGPAPRLAGLLESLAAGHAALTSSADPRTAIIACYAAMERGFAAAGSAPADADTPAEVLARAADAGIIRSSSPEVLTALFRRARYSAEPITSADSAAAAAALAQMRADLEAGLETRLEPGLEADLEPSHGGGR